MKIGNIPKKLQIQQPLLKRTSSKGGLKILGAGMRHHPHIKVFRPIRPGARRGHGHKRI